MDNEIKEILDSWKNGSFVLAYSFNYDRAKEQNDLLLDYITNLQQALKNTKETADDMLYELNEENEKLREENNIIKELNVCVGCETDYKSRIDEAIEYIEWQRDNPHYDNIWRKYECESLINILRGDDNET